MRTDIRHDYEHGSKREIEKKRKEIADVYNHYIGKTALINQKDYVDLQRKVYEEFIVLETHLLDMLCSGKDVETKALNN